MTAQFTDPALTKPAPAKERKLYNQWGQYLLPDPDTGKERAWVRATTLAKALEDTYNLEIWSNRMVAKGMALRPDLVAMAATLDVSADRDKLNKVAKDAKEAAGGSSGANMGTALHSMTEKLDAGEEVQPGPFARELAAYRRTMAQEGVVVLPQYSERIICVPELGVAGRLDKLAEWSGGGGQYQVMDLKSQKSMDFGGVSIAIQLSLYAHAYAMWDPATESWENPPPIDQILATVIWLPVGQDRCLLFDVDLVNGWEWAKLCAEVRRIRKAKPVTMREVLAPPADHGALGADLDDPLDPLARRGGPDFGKPVREAEEHWARLLRLAASPEELTKVGQDAAQRYGGALPDALKALGRELRAKFLVTKAS